MVYDHDEHDRPEDEYGHHPNPSIRSAVLLKLSHISPCCLLSGYTLVRQRDNLLQRLKAIVPSKTLRRTPPWCAASLRHRHRHRGVRSSRYQVTFDSRFQIRADAYNLAERSPHPFIYSAFQTNERAMSFRPPISNDACIH